MVVSITEKSSSLGNIRKGGYKWNKGPTTSQGDKLKDMAFFNDESYRSQLFVTGSGYLAGGSG